MYLCFVSKIARAAPSQSRSPLARPTIGGVRPRFHRAGLAQLAEHTQRKEGLHKIRRILHGRKARYRHGLPTHDNKNPMFCVIAYLITKIQ